MPGQHLRRARIRVKEQQPARSPIDRRGELGNEQVERLAFERVEEEHHGGVIRHVELERISVHELDR